MKAYLGLMFWDVGGVEEAILDFHVEQKDAEA